MSCPKCDKPMPRDYCWIGSMECPCRPPRGVDPIVFALHKRVTELIQRVDHLEERVKTTGP